MCICVFIDSTFSLWEALSVKGLRMTCPARALVSLGATSSTLDHHSTFCFLEDTFPVLTYLPLLQPPENKSLLKCTINTHPFIVLINMLRCLKNMHWLDWNNMSYHKVIQATESLIISLLEVVRWKPKFE
jgi:hypothetical protein